jgi:hypothetical protein
VLLPREHLKFRHFGEYVDDFFGKAVAEVLVLFIGTHVGKGQQGRLVPRLRGRVDHGHPLPVISFTV